MKKFTARLIFTLGLGLVLPSSAQADLATSFSSLCHTLLAPLLGNSVSHQVQVTQPRLTMEEVSLEFAEYAHGKKKNTNQLAKAFVQAYQFEAAQISTFEEAKNFFEIVDEVLRVKDADHIFNMSHATTHPTSTLWQIFGFNHTQWFLRLKLSLSPQEITELQKIIYSVRADADSNSHHIGVRRLWWKVIWLYDLVIQPEESLLRLINGLEQRAFFYDENNRPIHNIDLKGILLHSSDVIDAFSNMPSSLKTHARKLIIQKHYMTEKHKDALAILQSLNHEYIRSLAQTLSTLKSNNKLEAEKVITAVDTYWAQTGHLHGYEHPGAKKRGGYSFESVLQGLKGMGEKFEALAGRGKSILLFGSFPNGLSHLEVLTSGKVHFDSDLDMTFSNNNQFQTEGLINFHYQHWLNAKNRKSPLFKSLVEIEKTFAKNMKLEHFNRGTLVSPLPQFSFDSILKAKDFSGSTYVMLASPIALQIEAKKITLHLHYLPEGANEPITEAFSFALP